jgi:NAD(P) transhydrogenase alpha subunit
VTAAGKVPPAKVLVIGAGVAGLAAIGAARGLGAVVRAFDVRPEVAEQIESMGAEFLFLDFEDSASGEGGYAAPSSPEFREKQLQLFREQAPDVDIVITTALIPGRPAPKLWLEDMVRAMKPGSVVVDLAAERGGNCDLTVADQIVESENGVKIIGYTDFPAGWRPRPRRLYATNIRHLIDDLTPEGRAARRQHGGRRDPRRDGDARRRDHLSAAAAQGAGDRQAAEAEGAGEDGRAEGGRGRRGGEAGGPLPARRARPRLRSRCC